MNERKLPKDVFKSFLVEQSEFSEKLEYPIIKKTDLKLNKAIPFDKALKTNNFKQLVHFYIHDYLFERIWNNPKQYLNCLKKFKGVISPDFSIYRDMPLIMQMWNIYRNRALGSWFQNNEISVIPNVSWGDERTYKFCFEGIEKGGTVAVSTYGCIRGKENRYYFKQGLKEMIKDLEPETIINYSYTPDDIFLPYKKAGIEIIEIENYLDTVRKKAKD